MAKRKATAIFFEDLKEDAQKRIIAHEMATILDCEPDEVEVENITTDEDFYGYDEDPKEAGTAGAHPRRHQRRGLADGVGLLRA